MSERATARLFLAPTLVILASITGYPLIGSAWLSLQRRIVVFHESRFVGLSNYAFLIEDARFWGALGHTAYFAAVSVSIELVLGLGLSLLLHAPTPGRSLLRAAILVPWAIPTVISSKMWACLLNQDQGLVARLLPFRGVDWLGTPGYAMHAAILVDVWKTTPFVALLLLAGLSGISRDIYDAASIDGAGVTRSFFFVTLPLLRRTLTMTLLFRSLDAFRVFDAVYALTEGGPANTTETLSVYAYKTMMRSGDFGYGATLSMITFACVVAIGAVFLATLPRGEVTS